jgi:hypothetical protein
MDWGFLNAEITLYPLQCHSDLRSGKCPGRRAVLDPIVFKVFPGQQRVVYKFGRTPPDRAMHCIVQDRENWKCDYGVDTVMFGFNDGKYWEIVPEQFRAVDIMRNVYYVPRWRWLLAHVF